MVYKIFLWVYDFLFTIFSFFIVIYFLLSRNFIIRNRLYERLFLSSKDNQSNLKKRYIWIHGASVGELLSVKSLVHLISEKFPNYGILITSHTQTSQDVLKIEFKGIDIIYRFFPYDSSIIIKKFIKFYSPSLVLWIEQDFFPVTLSLIKKNNIPSLLINARMSDKSYYRWLIFKKLAYALVNNFSSIYAMSPKDKDKFSAFGLKPYFIGNLKYTNLLQNHDDKAVSKDLLKLYLKGNFVWFAISTHSTEEEICARVHKELIKDFSNLTTIIMPRHPHRIKNIVNIFEKNGLQTDMYSNIVGDGGQILLIDILGDTKLLSSLSDVAFIGKSLYLKGGHNLLEPLSVGCPVIFGENMSNFQSISEDCLINQAGIMVKTEEDLVSALRSLIINPQLLLKMKENTNFIHKEASVILDKYMREISCYLKN